MAMIEAYRIGVELVLGGDLAAGIEALIPGLTRLDAELTQANADAKDLAAALGGVAATATGVGQAADAVQRLTLAMATMNRAAEQFRTGGGMPPAGPAPNRGKPVTEPPPTVPGADQPPKERQAAPERVSAVQGLARLVQVSAPGVGTARPPVSAPPPPDSTPPPPPRRSALPKAAQTALATARTDEAVQVSTPQRPLPTVAGLDPPLPGPVPVTAPPSPGLRPTRAGPVAQLEQVLPAITGPGKAERPRPAAVPTPGDDRRPAGQAFASLQRDTLPQVNGRRRNEPVPGERRELPSAPPQREPRRPAIVLPLPEMMPLRIAATQPLASPNRAKPVRQAPSQAEGGLRSFRASLDGAARQPATRPIEELARSAKARPNLLRDALPAMPPQQTALATPPWQPGPDARRATNDAFRGAGRALPPQGEGLRSYHPQGGQPGPVIQHVTYLQLDERTIARAVTRQQLRMIGGQVSGTLRPDPSVAPQYGAHLLES